MRHEFPIVLFDGKPADFCGRCGAFKRSLDLSPECLGSLEARKAAAPKCTACSGSGYYDTTGSPRCGACGGTGLKR